MTSADAGLVTEKVTGWPNGPGFVNVTAMPPSPATQTALLVAAGFDGHSSGRSTVVERLSPAAEPDCHRTCAWAKISIEVGLDAGQVNEPPKENPLPAEKLPWTIGTIDAEPLATYQTRMSELVRALSPPNSVSSG